MRSGEYRPRSRRRSRTPLLTTPSLLFFPLRSPTITLGPYAGDQLSVDHIIPFAVAPGLDKVIANLELMPLRMNQGKRDRMGERQLALMMRFRRAEIIGR